MSLASLLGKPNLKALEAPIRAIVHEVLREQGYASPAEVQAIRDDARDLRARLDQVEARLAEAVKLAEAAKAEGASGWARAARPGCSSRSASRVARAAPLAAACSSTSCPSS